MQTTSIPPRTYKLGVDMHPEDSILDPITFSDVLLLLANTNTPMTREAVQKAYKSILNTHLSEAQYMLQNNMQEILRATQRAPEDWYEGKEADAAAKAVQAPRTPEQCEVLAYEILAFLRKHQLWQGVRIYFNGKALATDDGNSNFRYNGEPFLLEEQDPSMLMDYTADPHILTMSFEGPVYAMFNHDGLYQQLAEFDALIGSHGLYYELGNAWNLTMYEH